MCATCARTKKPRILFPLERMGLAEPKRKSREFRELRGHESDWVDRKATSHRGLDE